MSCGMIVTSFRPQTPAILPTPPMVLEGFSRTGRSAPFTSKFKGSPLLTWARKSDAAFAIPALIEVCFSCVFPRAAESLIAPKIWSQSPQSVGELRRLKALVISFRYSEDARHIAKTSGSIMGAGRSPSLLETTFPQRRFNSCVCTRGAPLCRWQSSPLTYR